MSFQFRFAISLGIILLTGLTAQAGSLVPGCAVPPTTFAGSGTAGAASALSAFQAAIGGVNNGGTATPQTGGFRAINWDAVALDGTDFGGVSLVISSGKTVGIPASRFQSRGVIFDRTHAVANDGFAAVDSNAAGQFPAFSGANTFAPFNTNTVTVNFVLAGSSTPALTRGFGAIFLDVESPNTSSIEYFNGTTSLGKFFAPTGPSAQPEFFGAIFAQPIVTSARITTGTAVLFTTNTVTTSPGPAESLPATDLVALDDMVYAEPTNTQASGAALAGQAGTNLSGTVATFTDPDSSASNLQFSATIDWGDGVVSAGTIVTDGSCFDVQGNHVYRTGGSFAITINIADFITPALTMHATATIAPLARADFQGDHKSDLFWRNVATGDDAEWLMNGASVAVNAALPTVDTGFSVAGIGDFQGDGKADIVWRNGTTGANVIWLMNGTSVAVSALLPSVADPNWTIAGVGDFQGDGKSDLLWRNSTTGDNAVWLMNGAAVVVSATLPSVAGSDWKVAAIGDLQGDGRDDVVWRNSVSGASVVWLMNGTTVGSTVPLPLVSDPNWQIVGAGDFQGDAKADLLWRNVATGDDAIWFMNGGTVSSTASLVSVLDTNWKIVRIGDFQGDGKADIVWRNSVTGAMALWLMNGPDIAVSATLPTVPDTNWQIAGVP